MSNPSEGAKGVVKFEHDDRLSATLGTGPPIASPSALSEDDIYEDAGDLEFPQGDQTVWLMRLPTFLWERWSTLGDDDEIEIGKVRVGTADKLTLFLSPNVDALKDLPKEYDLNMINQHSTNTYIFTEKDLPGYNSKQGQKLGAGVSKPSIPTRLLRRDRGHSKAYSKGEKWKRSEPYYRKAIPKRTAIAGVVKHEVACLPVESEAYVRLVAERNELASKPKRQTQRMKGLPNSNIQPGTGLKISTATKQKSQEQKATRVSKEQLLDAIYACFKEYEYWSLKSMRARLRQPETYLKETLEPIAELVKTGRFAMHWTLKPSYKEASYKGAEAAAPEASPEFETGSDLDDGSNEEDGNDDEMEDVVPP